MFGIAGGIHLDLYSRITYGIRLFSPNCLSCYSEVKKVVLVNSAVAV